MDDQHCITSLYNVLITSQFKHTVNKCHVCSFNYQKTTKQPSTGSCRQKFFRISIVRTDMAAAVNST